MVATTSTASWHDRRKQLKQEICNYFAAHGADKKKLIEICNLIRIESEVITEIVVDYLSDKQSVESVKKSLNEFAEEKFSPPHREIVKAFLGRAIALDTELKLSLKAQRYWQDPERCWARDDFELEDYEASLPKAEMLVSFDHIIVHCFEWVDGFKERLPRGGEYQGKGTGKWKYPLSARSQLEKLGLPVVKYPGVE